MMRVLVAEDHVTLAETVAAGLRREGMAAGVAFDGLGQVHRTPALRSLGNGEGAGPDGPAAARLSRPPARVCSG